MNKNQTALAYEAPQLSVEIIELESGIAQTSTTLNQEYENESDQDHTIGW